MTKALAKFTKKFTLVMSNKSEFILDDIEMKKFEYAALNKALYGTKDGGLINPAFFVEAKAFSAIDGLSDYQLRKLSEKEATIKGKVTNEMRLKWANKLLNNELLFE